ncbi:guanine nucleotide exchange factor DBS [Callorhinchus milii]|uniref:guanine nucleotide exchange factor DBS n=1 Tax=Callorhinchus milii TaxID=7868 RepID=UPI00045760C8|nr:guanine nucleotide exchange factor DBS [Callorhinchus milii]|eukprot:gi/632948814/ref/XP_007889807.1/ PREDICTED: guanine nucleotide exchange factor DBS [Callorhinchus milii]
MQQDSGPLYAAAIAEELTKQFAFRSGGRAENGGPIITFPDYPSFSDIPEQEFQSVISYLTSVPSLQDAGIGFILLIDRRQDKWSSVKTSLLRIVGSFPGNLQLVFVLRPSGIFQRAIFDIVLKLNQDDFKMKVPVIMLNSVTELHSYIDKTQLTEELGGTLEYCHSQWLGHRTAIESFAVMVKDTAQMLQAFGTELAETELPNDATSTMSLLTVHTEKRDKMKRDIDLALKKGHSLLSSIREPITKNSDYILNADQLDHQSNVQRLLAQLNETETAFDEFWNKHQLKLEQCLQLRHFEHDFREIKNTLDILAERQNTFTDIGNSSSHVEHIMRDLCNLEDKSQEYLEKALALILQGDELIQNNHYAVDSILPKCNEMRRVCDEFTNGITTKKEFLNLSMDLHKRLEKASEWCESGVYLLASQPIDKCQSQDGAEAALQEIEKFLESATDQRLDDLGRINKDYGLILNKELVAQVQRIFQKQEAMEEMFEKRNVSLKKLAAKQTRPVQSVAPRPEGLPRSPRSSPDHYQGPDSSSSPIAQISMFKKNKSLSKIEMNEFDGRQSNSSESEENLAILRRHVINELIETERVYVEELLCVLEGYAAEMENPSMILLMPIALQNKKDVLFGNMPEIYDFHNRIFLRELENYVEYPELVGRCFLARRGELQIYERYCQNKPRSESLWRQCSDCVFFQECQRKLEHKLGLDSYLLKPVQRITKYHLLLKELLKYSKNCEGAEDLQEALTAILGILKAVNDSMHQIAITGYEGNLNELGKLLMQGSFNVWIDHKKGHAKVKDLARFKPMQRHLFLHEKVLLFCKRREENGEGYEKAPSYSYKHSLNMTTVGITENVKGDHKKFEIWYNAREEVYIVQAATQEIKNTWINEIRKILTGQLQAYRVTNQNQKVENTSMAPLASPIHTSPLRSQSKIRRSEGVSLENRNIALALLKSQEKGKDEAATSATSDRSAAAKKRLTLQGFSNLKSQKESPSTTAKSRTLPLTLRSRPASPTSPDSKSERHEVKSDPTPFGFRGWNRTSHSLDATEENNDGWSSADDQLNSSDGEEETGKKMFPGKYTVLSDYEKGGTDEFSVRSGDMLQLIREGEEGQWFVKNLNTNKEGWVPAANLQTLIGDSKSFQSISSSESASGSSTMSSSSSCAESCTVCSNGVSDIKG